jgi:hypothetical protein
VRGPSGNRLHGGLWELAHPASSGELAAGGFPCWQIADRVVGRAASPLAARCARDVLASHDLNIIHYITLHYPPAPPGHPGVRGARGARGCSRRAAAPCCGSPNCIFDMSSASSLACSRLLVAACPRLAIQEQPHFKNVSKSLAWVWSREQINETKASRKSVAAHPRAPRAAAPACNRKWPLDC